MPSNLSRWIDDLRLLHQMKRRQAEVLRKLDVIYCKLQVTCQKAKH